MKILCPTDLSEHSIIALQYATNLCNDLDAELHIISAYQVSRKASSFINLDEQIRQNTQEDLDAIIAGITPLIKNDRLPHSSVFKGNAVSTILGYTRDNEIDLIIMGTQGSNSLSNILFGSVTKKVASKAEVPILAIPMTIKERLQSNKVLMALDDKILNSESTFKIPKLIANKLGLKIDILHIQKEDEDFPFDPFISMFLGNCLGDVMIKKGKDPVTEIKSYSEENNFGMLIMVKRKKSFFTKLFNVGNTSEEIARTNTPLMILPE